MSFRTLIVGLILVIILMTFTASLWINNNPLFLVYNNKTYFPIFFKYSPEEFDLTDQVVVDYLLLNKKKVNYILWPPLVMNPNQIHWRLEKFPAPPNSNNIFGTDEVGRDVFVIIMYGVRNLIFFALIGYLFSILASTFLSFVGFYFPNKVRIFFQEYLELLTSIPFIFYWLIAISFFEVNYYLLLSLNIFTGGTRIYLYINQQIKILISEDYIRAVKLLGATDKYIFLKNVVPRLSAQLIHISPYYILEFVIQLTVLDFIGLGIDSSIPNLGNLTFQGYKYFESAPWLIIYPGISMILLFSILKYFVSDLTEKI